MVINRLKQAFHLKWSANVGPSRLSGQKLEVKYMFCSNDDLLISIQDTTNTVVSEYGVDVAKSVFRRFGATCAEDLDPSDYEAAFSELYLIANDN